MRTVTPSNRASSLVRRYKCNWEVNGAGATADFHENLDLEQVPHCHACGFPRVEAMGNGDCPASASRLLLLACTAPPLVGIVTLPSGSGLLLVLT